MINIAIVDDSKEVCDIIHQKVVNLFQKENLDYRIYCFHNSEHLLKHLDITFNIIILDIEMPGLNGIDTAKLLRKKSIHSIIIFVANQIKYMEQAFGLNVLGFISKDKLDIQLPKVLSRCIDELKSDKLFDFKTNNGIVMIQKEDMIYATMEQRKVALYTIHEVYYLNLSTLNEFYIRMKMFDNFIYVNRSNIINLSYVSGITSTKSVILKGIKTPIPISLDKSVEVANKLLNWASNKSFI